MSNLSVVEHSGDLVVDSRLIAESLGIEHYNFLETIERHQTLIEQAYRTSFWGNPV
jgi:phage regulator Rha-like protein